MLEDFVTFFTEMEVVPTLMLIIGLLLCVIKIFQPGQNVFGVLGAVLVVVAIIFRMVTGGTVAHLFMLVFICFAVLTTSYMVMVATNRTGWFRKYKMQEQIITESIKGKETKIEQQDYSNILNLHGVAKSDFKPQGQIKINKTIYQAETEGEFISSKNKLVVARVEGNKIIVKKLKEEN